MFYFALFKMELVIWRLEDSTAQAQAEAPYFLVFRVTWGARAHTGDTPADPACGSAGGLNIFTSNGCQVRLMLAAYELHLPWSCDKSSLIPGLRVSIKEAMMWKTQEGRSIRCGQRWARSLSNRAWKPAYLILVYIVFIHTPFLLMHATVELLLVALWKKKKKAMLLMVQWSILTHFPQLQEVGLTE